jgi:hypothetical protein
MRTFMRIAPPRSRVEQRANDAGVRAQRAHMPPVSPLTARPDGPQTLTPAGRQFYEPVVGASLANVRVHVDDRAERLGKLAGAEAVTRDRDVFIPPSQFAPETARGRALLAHELAHTAQAPAMPGTIFRKDTPHYPSVDEWKEIERILGRHSARPVQKPSPAGSTAAPTEEIVDPGTTLSATDTDALATKLLVPYRAVVAKLDTGEPPVSVKSLDEAMNQSGRALKAVQDKFGAYIPTQISLTSDQSSKLGDRVAQHQVLVQYSFGDPDIEAFALTIITTHCPPCKDALDPLTQDSQTAVIDALLKKVHADATLFASVKRAAKHVGGAYNHSNRRLHLTPYTDDPYGTAVHELVHALTHPAFRAAFAAPSQRNVVEGFTEYFAREVAADRDRKGGSYDEPVAKVQSLRDAMKSPYLTFDVDSPEDSLRMAYFSGRLDLIGWRPQTDGEKKAVEAAGGAVAWKEASANTELKARNARAVAKQSPHDNNLGVGLYFQKGGDSMFAVRYARVIERSAPFARRQTYLEGQVLGSPTTDPRRLGGSFGIGIELQEPWFYLTGGVRLTGTGALSGAPLPRVDISPFVGVGTRLWQHIRVGADGFVLLPVTKDQKVVPAAGVTVGFEL